MKMHGRVLIVAGSDSGGGAGIQADIKTVTALGGFAMTAITALTAQNTQGVFGIHEVPIPFLRDQIRLVLEDLGADAVKLGMLHSSAVIEAVADSLERYAPGLPIVLDPVMVAKGGHPLLEPSAVHELKARLLPMASLITPNLPEAELLAGMRICDEDERRHAAAMMLTFGAKAVLLKGGHAPDPVVTDWLVTGTGTIVLEADRIETRHTHGTGCTLASAIATGLAQGMPLERAAVRAHDYVIKAIRSAPGYGHGHGPLNHAHTVKDGV